MTLGENGGNHRGEQDQADQPQLRHAFTVGLDALPDNRPTECHLIGR